METGQRGDVLVEFSGRFGTIAVNRGYVTPDQLKEALAEQVDDDLASRPHRLLGNIFFEKKLMNVNQIEEVLDQLVMDKFKQMGAVSKKKEKMIAQPATKWMRHCVGSWLTNKTSSPRSRPSPGPAS